MDSQTRDTEETLLVTSSRVLGLCSISSYFFPMQALPRYFPGWWMLQALTVALWAWQGKALLVSEELL